MAGHSWTNADIFKLIDMYQERELLWNTLLDDYKNRNKKYDAWMEIANEFNMDKHSVEKKMRSLIGQYQREDRRIKFYGGSDEKFSKWFAYKKFRFLKDHKPLTMPTIYVGMEDSYNGGESSGGEITGGEQTGGENNSNLKESLKEKYFAVPKRCRKRYRPAEQQDTSGDDQAPFKRPERNHIDAFGEYVAMKLKEIKNDYVRNTAELHINNILYNASIGQDDLLNTNEKNMKMSSVVGVDRW